MAQTTRSADSLEGGWMRTLGARIQTLLGEFVALVRLFSCPEDHEKIRTREAIENLSFHGPAGACLSRPSLLLPGAGTGADADGPCRDGGVGVVNCRGRRGAG